ncbi:hypothetical protein YC2023_010690 [Brassica napus]
MSTRIQHFFLIDRDVDDCIYSYAGCERKQGSPSLTNLYPDIPEGTRLVPKYTSAEDILESRLFTPI